MGIYLCISIDCECDKGPGWRTRKPLSFSGITEGIRNRLQPLFQHFGTKPSYLLSPEVLRNTDSLEILGTLGGNVELGTHLHGEFAEPGAFEPDVTSSFQCHYDHDTERRKLLHVTELFQAAFGWSPRAFRAGRFGIGRRSLGLLQELGYIVDSSVTPHKDWRTVGAQLSFSDAPTQPYWPVLDDPQRAAPSGTILEVPVTIRPSPLRNVAVVGRWAEPRWLRPTRNRVAQLISIAREEISSALPEQPIVLNCMFHNVEVVPTMSPYAQTEEAANSVLHRLAGLLAFAQNEGIRSIGLADVPELFDH